MNRHKKKKRIKNLRFWFEPISCIAVIRRRGFMHINDSMLSYKYIKCIERKLLASILRVNFTCDEQDLLIFYQKKVFASS